MAKKSFSLPDKKVTVRFVKRQTGNITNKNHIAYGGKLEGAFDVLPAKMRRDGKYERFLTEIEQEELEKLLGRDSGSLSTHKKVDNFWDDISITLGKEGLILDLSDPWDYIKYKVLLAYDDMISPSITETSFKRTYRYELVTVDDVRDKLKKDVNYDIKAYDLLSEIKDSKEQLVGILRMVTNKKYSTETDHDFLVAKVAQAIKEDSKRFVEILEDPDYQIKLLIEKAIDNGKAVRERGLYRTIDGIELCEEGLTPTLDNAIDFLQLKKNQDIKLLLKS